MKSFLRKIIPKPLLRFYHLLLAELAAFIYGYPSKRMVVIGVTGTKGKSSTAYLLAKILESAGYKVGLTSTIMFKVGERERLNPYKMTMLGRFKLQALLSEMARSDVQYAVIETSSEGILQSRHRGIDYNAAVFTNLSPEHIESHGNYANYRAAKAKLFEHLKRKKINGHQIPRVIIANADDAEAEYFLSFPADEKYGFSLNGRRRGDAAPVFGRDVVSGAGGSRFKIDDENFDIKLIGRFNVYNALAAATAALALGVHLRDIRAALAQISSIPGRLEFVDEGQPFKIIVDYAHEPKSMEEIYAAINLIPHRRIIHVFGGTGGGRDKSKRAVLGAIAAKSANVVIVTNDDPYGENQDTIADQIIGGIKSALNEIPYEKILDRREAIHRALDSASEGDLVLISGKGAEQAMMIGGKKAPWDDRKVVREEMRKIF